MPSPGTQHGNQAASPHLCPGMTAMNPLARYFAPIFLALLPLASAGCATMNWDAVLEGVTAAFDDVLDEAAASGGTESLRETTNRVWERRVDDSRVAQDHFLQELAEERQTLRDEGAVVCPFNDYGDYFAHLLENHKNALSLRADGGDGFMGTLLNGMAEAFEREFSETLKDCAPMTERFIQGDIPLLHGDDRLVRLLGYAIVRSEEWQEMEREYFPVVRRWASGLYWR